MRVRAIGVLAAGVAAMVATGSAHAGGSPSKVVIAGGAGQSRVVHLTAGEGNALYAGGSRTAPHGGYLRIFPLFGGMPGLAGRFYPGAGVVCFDAPQASCHEAAPAIRRMLRSAHLRSLRGRPARVVRLRSGPRSAVDTLATAVEMALDRRGRAAAPPHGAIVNLLATWRGAHAASRPRRLELEPRGIYVSGRLHPLSRTIWTSFGRRLVVPPPFRIVPWHGGTSSSPGSSRWLVAAAIAAVAALATLGTSIAVVTRRKVGGSGA
jgi:hypothetical protein